MNIILYKAGLSFALSAGKARKNYDLYSGRRCWIPTSWEIFAPKDYILNIVRRINILNIYRSLFTSSKRLSSADLKYRIYFLKHAIWRGLPKRAGKGFFALFLAKTGDTASIVASLKVGRRYLSEGCNTANEPNLYPSHVIYCGFTCRLRLIVRIFLT